MAEQSLIPSSIRDSRMLSLEALIQRIGNPDDDNSQHNWGLKISDISLANCMMIYDFDHVPAEALDLLAAQFHQYGDEVWTFLTTEQPRRNYLKERAKLWRLKGTIWSVKRALFLCGFTNVTISDSPEPILLDGSWVLDGSRFLTGEGYYCFNVEITGGSELTALQLVQVRKIIEEYKPARSHLIALVSHVEIPE